MRLIHSGPFLAEYDRELVLRPSEGERSEVIFSDTGGYALVNVYRESPSRFILVTVGNHDWVVDAGNGALSQRPATEVHFERVDGGFEYRVHRGVRLRRERRWRFIPREERAERVVGRF